VGTGHAVEFALKREGLRKFNQLAKAGFRKQTPLDQVAIVVKGRVISDPAFQSASFSGPIQITGNFTAAEAAKLAKAIDRAAR
jgi:preprotein translocase subunit SecD